MRHGGADLMNFPQSPAGINGALRGNGKILNATCWPMARYIHIVFNNGSRL